MRQLLADATIDELEGERAGSPVRTNRASSHAQDDPPGEGRGRATDDLQELETERTDAA